MDTIASMRAFVAVAKTGSFTAAAQKLDLVPSADHEEGATLREQPSDHE